jgi:hypothetical protein
MADASIFQIEQGEFALTRVDKTVPGYSELWQAPGGKDVMTVTLADYTDAVGLGWVCQVTSGALTPEPSTTTSDVPATFCSPARTTPTPGETGYTLDASFLQDPHIRQGLSRYLFENDTLEAYFLLGLDGINPPKAIGRVRIQAGAIGGEARTTLTTDISLPLSRKPQIAFGDSGGADMVPPTPVAALIGIAGTPGTWDPPGSVPPATHADLAAGIPNVVTAQPLTRWEGTYVNTADGQPSWWDSTAWQPGIGPIYANTGNAGTPGTWGPVGCVPPADLASLAAGIPVTVQALPPIWTADQYIETADGADCTWDGAAWVAWTAPPAGPPTITVPLVTDPVSLTADGATAVPFSFTVNSDGAADYALPDSTVTILDNMALMTSVAGDFVLDITAPAALVGSYSFPAAGLGQTDVALPLLVAAPGDTVVTGTITAAATAVVGSWPDCYVSAANATDAVTASAPFVVDVA